MKLLLVGVSLVFVELCLQVAAGMSDRADMLLSAPWDPKFTSARIVDPVLSFRPNPHLPDHDHNGFRNPSVPERAEVVVLGDSQTYGTGVAASDAWPRALERLLDAKVYEMAAGGYGPVHSILLLKDAARLTPRVIVATLYAGNDLYDAYSAVYLERLAPGLSSPSSVVQATVRGVEHQSPLQDRILRMFYMDHVPERTAEPYDERRAAENRPILSAWATDHFRLYGLLRRLQYEVVRPRARMEPTDPESAWAAARHFASTHETFTLPIELDRARTILTPRYRLTALDLDDPRIAEGQRIAYQCVSEMDRNAHSHGMQFLLLLLPTKELVFNMGESPRDSADYALLIGNETRFWRETKRYLEQHDIRYVDALSALRHQLEANVSPYPVTFDGHPNPAGHRAIAEVVAAQLGRIRADDR